MKLSEQERLEAEKKLKYLSTEMNIAETIKVKVSIFNPTQRNKPRRYKDSLHKSRILNRLTLSRLS